MEGTRDVARSGRHRHSGGRVSEGSPEMVTYSRATVNRREYFCHDLRDDSHSRLPFPAAPATDYWSLSSIEHFVSTMTEGFPAQHFGRVAYHTLSPFPEFMTAPQNERVSSSNRSKANS